MERTDIVWVHEERCTLCGLCVPVCVRRLLEPGPGSVRVTDPGRCIQCGHCKAVCPEDALGLGGLDEAEFSRAPRRGEFPSPEGLMAFFRARRSCRIYERRPVERTKILQLLEAGRFAPSGGNRQPLGYVVLQSPEALADARRMAMGALGERAVQIRQEAAAKLQRGERLSAAEAALQINAQMWLDMPGLLDKGDDRLFYFAPAVIVCHGDHPSASMEVDAGLAGMQMALMAEALGLGTCFCHFLVFALEQSAALRAALRVPEGRKTAFALLVGYPDVTFSRLVARNAAAVQWV